MNPFVRRGTRWESGTLVLLELDHVLIAVADLEAASHEIEARHGLASIEGGRHPGWGTANRIVPLGETYIELVAVVEEGDAARSGFGRWVGKAARPGLGRPLGWAVRTPGLDDAARRLGLAVGGGSRAAPGGQVLRWRSAGIEQASAEPLLPFFIEWGRGRRFPAVRQSPTQPVPSSSRSWSSKATPLDSPPGSAATGFRFPCAQVNLRSPASSSWEPRGRSSSSVRSPTSRLDAESSVSAAGQGRP